MYTCLPIRIMIDKTTRIRFNIVRNYRYEDNLDIQHIIVRGDLNTDPSRLRSLHSITLNDILFENNLFSWLSSEFCTADYSYESKVNGSRSLIEHFVMSNMLFKQLYKADALIIIIIIYFSTFGTAHIP